MKRDLKGHWRFYVIRSYSICSIDRIDYYIELKYFNFGSSLIE